jgi:hypothetical protein
VRYQFLLFITILSFSIIFAGCGNSVQPVNNAANGNAANANAVVVNNANNLIQTNKKPEAETTNNAPTLAPVVTAYYDALKKKDEAAVRKVVSQDTLKVWEGDMKADNEKSLVSFLIKNDTIPEKPMEVRNEKIEGNAGVAEIKGGSYGVWTPFKFVRENGEWKITNQSPDFDDVKKSASPSNTAK